MLGLFIQVHFFANATFATLIADGMPKCLRLGRPSSFLARLLPFSVLTILVQFTRFVPSFLTVVYKLNKNELF